MAGLGKVIYPSGDVEKDMEEIRIFYTNIKAKIPSKFDLSSIVP